MKDLTEGSKTYASVEDLLRYGCNDPEMADAVAQHGRWRDRVESNPLVRRPRKRFPRRSRSHLQMLHPKHFNELKGI